MANADKTDCSLPVPYLKVLSECTNSCDGKMWGKEARLMEVKNHTKSDWEWEYLWTYALGEGCFVKTAISQHDSSFGINTIINLPSSLLGTLLVSRHCWL